MSETSNVTGQNLDFSALVSAAEKGASFSALTAAAANAANDPKLLSDAAAANAPLERIRAYVKANPDNPLVKANQHLVPSIGAETWFATGNISLSSAYWWALGGGLAFPGQAPLAFLMGGNGKDWGAWATFTSVVAGSFVVDPKTIPALPEFKLVNTPIGWVKEGPCQITLSGGAVGDGAVNMQFARMQEHGGTYWGSVSGIAVGAGYAGFSGWITLQWQGF
jgi:hypothetical protein